MTLTTLEPLQLEDYDFAPPCDDCSAAAEYALRTIWCPRLFCELHKTALLEWLSWKAGTGCTAYCTYHLQPRVELTKVSDFVVSVSKL